MHKRRNKKRGSRGHSPSLAKVAVESVTSLLLPRESTMSGIRSPMRHWHSPRSRFKRRAREDRKKNHNRRQKIALRCAKRTASRDVGVATAAPRFRRRRARATTRARRSPPHVRDARHYTRTWAVALRACARSHLYADGDVRVTSGDPSLSSRICLYFRFSITSTYAYVLLLYYIYCCMNVVFVKLCVECFSL